MLNLGLYIHEMAAITPSILQGIQLESAQASEPDYSEFVPAMQLRRMSKAVRMGIGASHACLKAHGTKKPDAILVGTSLGCLADTETFLKKMHVQEEAMLTPTAFIQSTHNTIAGQIALHHSCMGYNTTISQHGHSFEGALLACSLYLQENPEHLALIGAVDEFTPSSRQLMARASLLSDPLTKTSPVFGEGAACFLASLNPDEAICRISGIETFTEKDLEKVMGRLKELIATTGDHHSGELLLCGGCNPGSEYTKVYEGIKEQWATVKGSSDIDFKSSIGEWGTVIAAALVQARPLLSKYRRIWFLNNYCHDWSFLCLDTSRTES